MVALHRLACLLALLAMPGTAWAEEARTVPALGSKLTYRFVATTTNPAGTTTAGEVYTYIVTASGDASAEGIIKPVALIIHCKGGAGDPGCRQPAKAAGAHFDGDLLTIPIASDVGDALAKQGHFKYAYFLQVLRRLPVPGAREAEHPNLDDIGPEPIFVATNTLQCDLAGLPAFLPVGTAAQVTLPCEAAFERSASRDGRIAAQRMQDTISFQIAYTGSGWASLPSGNWEVKKLAFKMIPADPKHIASEGESLFSPQLGIAVKTRQTGHNPAAHSTTESTIELISVEP